MLLSLSVPASADAVPGGGGDPPSGSEECTGGTGSGKAGTSLLRPPGPFTETVGIAPPDNLSPAPIGVDVTIAPGPDEDFQPVRLVEVSAVPKAKVLRDGSLDPGHARNVWAFTVEQYCAVNDTVARCTYTYHEMPDGHVWELTTVAGQLFEHTFLVVCAGADAWRAGPEDRGARLLAAAKANVAGDAHLAVLAPALRAAFLGAGGQGAGADGALLAAMHQLTSSGASVAALAPGFVNAITAAGWVGAFGIGVYLTLLAPCYGATLPIVAMGVLTAAAITAAAVWSGSQAAVSFGGAVVGFVSMIVAFGIQIATCFAGIGVGGVTMPGIVVCLGVSGLAILFPAMYSNQPWVVERIRVRFTWAGVAIPLGFSLLDQLG
jgi:hypothetical protein